MNYIKDLPSEDQLLQAYDNPHKDEPLLVNAHFHTPYSFSSFSKIQDIFEQAEHEGIDVLGINDFISTSGYAEFNTLAHSYKKFPLFNVEFMGLMKEAQEKEIRINDPSNPGRIYFCGKGLKFPVSFSDASEKRLQEILEKSTLQTKKMTRLLNAHIKKIKAPFDLDFNDIQSKYSKGLVRERHLAKALRIQIVNSFPDIQKRSEFLNTLYEGVNSNTNANKPTELDNELRSRLLKKGGIAFVEEDNDAFLSLDEMRSIIIDGGGIPCYPVLLDDSNMNFTDFEKDFNSLATELAKNRIFAVELIPVRNNFKILKKFINILDEKGFLITFGTEHNTPDPAPLQVGCRDNVPLDSDLLTVGYHGACILAANQYLIAKGKDGYLTSSGFPRLERQDDFIKLGNAIIRKFIEL